MPAEIKAQRYGQCDMSGHKLITPGHGDALHKKGGRVRIMLNGAKVTGERLNDPFFEKMKLTGIEVQWSNPSFLVTHEKSIIVDGKSALLPTSTSWKNTSRPLATTGS